MLGAVAASKARCPHVTAFVSPEERLTYQDLWRTATALGHGLRNLGIGEESRVGLLCRNG
jgi:acyl-CoA synthetase (AMP-forming)/AMP-acid ligase II